MAGGSILVRGCASCVSAELQVRVSDLPAAPSPEQVKALMEGRVTAPLSSKPESIPSHLLSAGSTSCQHAAAAALTHFCSRFWQL